MASIQTLQEAVENYRVALPSPKTQRTTQVAPCVLKKIPKRAAAEKLNDVEEYCRLLNRTLGMPSFGLSYLAEDLPEGASFMHSQVS